MTPSSPSSSTSVANSVAFCSTEDSSSDLPAVKQMVSMDLWVTSPPERYSASARLFIRSSIQPCSNISCKTCKMVWPVAYERSATEGHATDPESVVPENVA